ncbi:hypothetical protein CICLE_v10010581mg [Citrus x clementina]|uniref:Elongation factor Ts, mitochondrial n=1 Tax=Citrus clementina TaxID=85681 RepID=V4UQR1_CITCL|nr:hypothetical protein CICLE_v10010581mg [Citrus x clementina]
MTPVIPCSISSISSIPVTAFTIKKNNCLTRYNSTRKSTKQTISSQRFLLPLPSSVRFFSQFQSGSALQHKFALHIISATGINVSVEESDSPTADDDSVGASDIPSDVETSESSSIKSEASPTLVESRRSRISRKSEMPPIKNEDLIPGATFTRKVRSIQPFGAFIDFGAFTDGLVHVSRLSDNFVKDVGSIVSVGQEVKVRLIEANAKTGRISLTMSESDDISMLQQQKDATASGDKVRTARRSTSKPGQKKDEMKTTKFVKGQDLEGTVKNLTRSSAFISLPEGEEGFLPTSEESDDGFANMMGGSSLQVGQEVSVRVLRISRGQVTLTMKKEDDVGLNLQLTQGVIHAATNPFVLAFRSNKDISSFLDERDKSATAAKKLEKPTPIEIRGEIIGEAASTNLSGEIAEQVSVFDSPKDEEVVQNQTDDVIAKDEEQIQTPTTESEIPLAGSLKEKESGPIPDKNGSIISSGEEPDISSSQKTKATVSPALVKQLREETEAGMMDCKKALVETGGDIIKAQEFLRKKGLASAEKKASRATAEGRIGSYIYDSRIGVMVEVNCETDFVSQGDIFKELVDDLAMQVVACPQVKYIVTEDVPEEILNKEKEIEMQKEDLLSKPEQIRSKIVEGRIRKRLEELALLEQPYIKNDKMVGLEKKSQDFAAEVAAQTAAKPIAKEQPAPAETKETVEKPPAVAVSAALVKQLREETGAGMMDCKKALSETRGDLEKAQEYLRKKGLSSADKKSGRLTAEGRIGSYIHDSRIGVLIEVNCEIDFVGRSEKFKELVDDLAMQVVACPQVQFISIEDILEDIINKEKEIEMQREDLISKPENIRERIIEGRIIKRLGELALSEQPFIKDDSVLVKDLVKQTVAAIGENIKVRRFVRFTLGETYEETQTETEA